jgi:hypothetical protein
MPPQVIGVFQSADAAARARADLVRRGVALERIAMSADFSHDAIAAEAPGQSVNQLAEHRTDFPEGSDADVVRSGTCALTVKPKSDAELNLVRDVLLHEGGRLQPGPAARTPLG